MKTLIIYTSKYGSTKEYAYFLKDELGADIYSTKEIDVKIINNYSTVILASPTYMGQIKIRKFLSKNWNKLSSKKVILLVVGMLPKNNPESKKAYEMIREDIRKGILYLKVPGRMQYEKLNLLEKLIARAIIHQGDFNSVNKSNLQPIISYFDKF